MKSTRSRLLALAATLLCTPLANASEPGPASLTPEATMEACTRISHTGALDIVKSLIALRASLPRVPAEEAALFDAPGQHSPGEADAITRQPYFFAWQIERHLDEAINVLGRLPSLQPPATRIGLRINQANDALSHLTAAMTILTYSAVQESLVANTGSPSALTPTMIRDRAHDLLNIALDVNVLISCNLMVPR